MLALYDPSALVINEIHADLEKPTEYGNGEVELYNWGAEPIDISRWYLENKTGYVLATIENREIGPLEFLVVDVIGLTGDSQEVTLFDSEGYERDSAMYSGATSHIGSCYARISDGLGNWVWTTICTLGSSNRMGPY